MKKSIFATSLFIICILLLLSGCVENELLSLQSNSSLNQGNSLEMNAFPLRMTEADYNSTNTYYMLNDDEPSTTYFDNAQRSFRVNQPLQLEMTHECDLQFKFYSPRAINNLTVWATIEGYPEEFKFAEFETVMPFQQFNTRIPLATKDLTARTRSGKLIKIIANPRITGANFALRVECDDPYYQKLISTQCNWLITFSGYSGEGYWQYKLLPPHAREAVALALNMSYMYSTQEFKKELLAWGPLHSDNNKTLIDKEGLFKRAISQAGLNFGHCSGVNGLGGGNTFGLNEWCFLEHYADDTNETHTVFHEFAHCLGYGHDGNMTYEGTGPGWITLCANVWRTMSLNKELPIYSRRFMHTRLNKNRYNDNNLYVTSKHLIEGAELDALDGGLRGESNRLPADPHGNQGAALEFTLNYEDAGVATNNYLPRGVHVYDNTMYVANNIRNADASVDVYDLSSGKPMHIKRITEWTTPAAERIAFSEKGAPTSVYRYNNRLYITGFNSTIYVLDADTYQCISQIKRSTHEVAVSDGVVYSMNDRMAAYWEKEVVEKPLIDKIVAQTGTLGGGTNSLTIDHKGVPYAVSLNGKQLIRIDDSQLVSSRLTEQKQEERMTFDKTVNSAAFSSDGRLFVVLGGKELHEVNTTTGQLIKNYTTVGSITLREPLRISIRRNTLFVVDKHNNAKCVYAIPMSRFQ